VPLPELRAPTYPFPLGYCQARGSDPVNPVGLNVSVNRYVGATIAETRSLAVTRVRDRGRGDWEVVLWWGHGRGEVEFSIVKGYVWGPRGQSNPWRLDPASARALLVACAPELGGVPELCQLPSWWASEEPH
jgi:hypothetical protein